MAPYKGDIPQMLAGSSQQDESVTTYVCVECGAAVQELYHRYPGDIIKMLHCEKCGNVADTYIECDSMVIFLDALLHKPQAYRHVLLNTVPTWDWKLMILLALAETYHKIEIGNQDKSTTADYTSQRLLNAAFELQFYQSLFISLMEWLIFLGFFMLLVHLSDKWNRFPVKHGLTSRVLLRGIILSSFGRLFVIAAILWGQAHTSMYLMLSQLFVFTSNVTALKVLCNVKRTRALFLVLGANAVRVLFHYYVPDISR